MELIAEYLTVHKKINPWLNSFLNERKWFPYQQQLANHIQKGNHLSGRNLYVLGRGSGKTGVQMAMLREMLLHQPGTWHTLKEQAQPISFQVSDHLSQDSINNPFSDALIKMGRTYIQQLDQQIYEGLGVPIEFQNGSRINPMPSFDAVRGQIRHDFQMEYMAEWVGDNGGDVSAVFDDSGRQAE